MLPINEMLLFVDIAELKSFSAVARKHKLSAAEVTKQVRLLEKRLELRLLERSAKEFTLTEAGEELVRNTLKVIGDFEVAVDLAREMRQGSEGRVVIDAPTNYSNHVLAKVVAEFNRDYPEIDVRVISNDSHTLPAVGSYDIAIREGVPGDPSVICQRLDTVRLTLCGSPDYLDQYEEIVKPEDLNDHYCLENDRRVGGKIWSFYKDGEETQIMIKAQVNSNSAFLVKEVALQGNGIAFLPWFMIRDEVKAGLLRPILTDYDTPVRPISVITPPQSQTQSVTAFMSTLIVMLRRISVED